jgi:hypothetical protein
MQFDVTYWQPKLYSAVAEEAEVGRALADYIEANPGREGSHRASAVLTQMANGFEPSDMGIVARALMRAGFEAPKGTEPDQSDKASDYTAEVRPS